MTLAESSRAQPATSTVVPFVDLRSQHDEVRAEIDAALADILNRSAFIGGEAVTGFEREFALYLGVPFVVGVSDGTEAVKIALQAVGVRPGDAIVTVAHTFIGTVEGAVQMDVEPIFMDVDSQSATMDPAQLVRLFEAECTPSANGVVHTATGRRIGAIVPVHLYGQSADMAPILEVGARFGVPVVEDAAQAQGATYRFPDGRVVRCGAMGDASAFSFYPGKNLGAIGEAGAVAVRTEDAARHARLLRAHGEEERYVHQIAEGGNGRLDAIQAEVLRIKLRRLDRWNDARRRAAGWYRERLIGLPIELPTERAGEIHVQHLFVVGVADRDRVRADMDRAGVATGIHYPIPLHRQPAFRGRPGAFRSLPVTERLASRCVSLPMFPHISEAQVDRVADALRTCLS
ncbi:MAG TPA: DegT/DnrJ/EryC1/StrS family aminotransferase [Longimicrobiales bacterium]